ncbi:glucose-6-phosphate isomerase [Litorilituus lipolyticus]|uniref:Glucose-6-phosphate isomerase n=1 Tax=Litorilituus lipolyticus TaxID=2491017 RepID=A0A502L077_9GAMM|nr:glucose-6-phosphate isomerase [Litorilituus lipolyticus]TPH17086.1 glucose-6-phosphate isomerase [Litorilituus lipolyticus]
MDFLNKIAKEQSQRNQCIMELFDDSERASDFSVCAANLLLDYSKQNINRGELTDLMTWAKKSHLTSKINSMFSGDKVNNTEKRSVLHTILRVPTEIRNEMFGGLSLEIHNAEKQMALIVENVSEGKYKSFTGKTYTDVLAIGIGGSYYGVKVALSALSQYNSTNLKVHLLANVDGRAVANKLEKLDAETTLVVVISKTFTTQETLLNAETVKDWMTGELRSIEAITQQWFAVSSNVEKALAFGLKKDNILPMWDWVGGRFSIWSAVGLPLALAIGNDNFSLFKEGAYEMDKHFQQADFDQNMPVLLAILGIWNRNVLNYSSLAVLPYEHSLRIFPAYLQQIDMESNGKSVSNEGKKISWSTAPIVFGQEGTNGQHAFMQLMHQSKDITPADFIVALRGNSKYKEHHKVLLANCIAQSEALMKGKSLEQAKAEIVSDEKFSLAAHKEMKGNTPSNTILLESISPESVGALMALYEHKIFVQGALWQINSFDQWGVELGKKLSSQVLSLMDNNTETENDMSASSLNLIKAYTQID